MRLTPRGVAFGREIPDVAVDILIHAAAPKYSDNEAVKDFRRYNTALAEYVRDRRPQMVINVSTWWLYAHGEARNIPYTVMKRDQMTMFPQATHIIPYSIYGEEPITGRGFIPHLVEHLRGGQRIRGLSGQRRDFIHVTDVARAIRAATLAPRGHYTARTGIMVTPEALAGEYGVRAGEWPEWPSADPRYPFPPVPEWAPRVDMRAHIGERITRRGGAADPSGVTDTGSGTR